MAIKIEKGIPAPFSALMLAHEVKAMELGDSFFIANCTDNQRSAYIRAAESLPGFGVLISAKATSTVDGAEVKGLRFWRAESSKRKKYQPIAPVTKP